MRTVNSLLPIALDYIKLSQLQTRAVLEDVSLATSYNLFPYGTLGRIQKSVIHNNFMGAYCIEITKVCVRVVTTPNESL